MIKLIGTVINAQAQLTDLVFQGDYADFGEAGKTGAVQKIIPANAAKPYVNRSVNFRFENDKLVSLVKTRGIHTLAMFLDGKQVDNRIALVKRVIRDDELVGFGVKFACGIECTRYYQDIIQLTEIFKPANFCVRKVGKLQKQYISGIAGHSLEALPEEVLFSSGQKVKKTGQNTGVVKGQTSVEKAQSVGNLNIDILNLYAVLKETGAYCMTLKGQKYERTTARTVVTGEDFRPLAISAISKARIEHSRDMMKVNLPFKALGMASVPGIPMPIFTHKFNTRAIFKNNENHVSRLGVAIPKDRENLLVNFLRSAKGLITFTELTDNDIKLNAASFIGKPVSALTFLELNMEGMKLLSDETLGKSTLKMSDLAKLVNKFECDNLIIKALKTKYKELAKAHGTIEKPQLQFEGYTQEMRDALKEAGINIFTGAYDKYEKNTNKDDKFKDIVDDTLTLGYSICAISPKTTGATILAYGGCQKPDARKKKKDADGNPIVQPTVILSEYIENYMTIFRQKEQELDPVAFMHYIKAELESLETLHDSIGETLWLHKMAMLQASDLKLIHQHDKDQWEPSDKATKGLIGFHSKESFGKLGVLKIECSPTITI